MRSASPTLRPHWPIAVGDRRGGDHELTETVCRGFGGSVREACDRFEPPETASWLTKQSNIEPWLSVVLSARNGGQPVRPEHRLEATRSCPPESIGVAVASNPEAESEPLLVWRGAGA